MKRYFFILLVLAGIAGKAQEDKTLKDVNVKPLVSFDGKNSFEGDKKVKIRGFRLGVAYGCKHKFGFGFYLLASPVKTLDLNMDETIKLTAQDQYTNIYMKYATVFYEMTWINEKRVEFATPLQIGVASLEKRYSDVNNGLMNYYAETAPIADFTGTFMYRILPFFWMGGGIGYRQVVSADQQINHALNSPYYLIRFKFGGKCKD